MQHHAPQPATGMPERDPVVAKTDDDENSQKGNGKWNADKKCSDGKALSLSLDQGVRQALLVVYF